MTLSELFKKAIKYLPEEEFLCLAIGKVIEDESKKYSTDDAGMAARKELYRLNCRAKNIVMTLLEGYISLDGWMANHKEMRSTYYSCLTKEREKMMLKTRKAWARHLAKQYKGVK